MIVISSPYLQLFACNALANAGKTAKYANTNAIISGSKAPIKIATNAIKTPTRATANARSIA